MKAIIHEKYGSPAGLRIAEVKQPQPKSKEILIRVLAASANKADWYLLQGKPFPVRLMAGLFKPKYKILGADVSGIVERVGEKVTQFKPGDEVYGDLSGSGFGAFAEFVVTNETQIARKPSNLSHEHAAALPMAALTALQGLRNQGQIKADQNVLINGASGGVGSFAVQIAKYFGAHVTAVVSEKKVEQTWQLGADKVIDYGKSDFTKASETYDLIFDVVGNHPLDSIALVLKKKGRYVTSAFSLSVLVKGPWKAIRQDKVFKNFMSNANQADLQFISKLAEEDQIKPVIQKNVTLDDVPEALETMGNRGNSGKIVVTI